MPKLRIGHRKARTYFENIEELFDVLTKYAENKQQRTYEEIMKWFSNSLAATAKQNFLSGTHPEEKAVESLHEYIETYILCGACTNPETTLFTNGKELFTNCKACGKEVKVKSKQSKYNKYLIKLLG